MTSGLFDLLVYHPETVAAIRIGLVAVGAALVVAAVGAKFLRRKDRVLVSDRVAVRLFAVALVAFPVSCIMATGSTHCDFLSFQAVGSLVLTMAGTLVATSGTFGSTSSCSCSSVRLRRRSDGLRYGIISA